jgi:hypothetical protein
VICIEPFTPHEGDDKLYLKSLIAVKEEVEGKL